jgi:dCTP deaminase
MSTIPSTFVDESEYSVLSDRAILREMANQNIIIEPFCESHLATSSYDVTLGPFFYREQRPSNYEENCLFPYNPYSKKQVEQIWGKPFEAQKVSSILEQKNQEVFKEVLKEGISTKDSVIWIRPGETILAHTNEFIGGLHSITTMMKARSSFGRNFIEICKCAGWGDIGYINRWTMEITNNSKYYTIPLVVGRRIAQIVFFKTEGILDSAYPEITNSKYQKTTTFAVLQKNWNPQMMLPRLYLDRECSSSSSSSDKKDTSATATSTTTSISKDTSATAATAAAISKDTSKSK